MTPDIKKTPEATNNLAGVFPFSGLRVFGSSRSHQTFQWYTKLIMQAAYHW